MYGVKCIAGQGRLLFPLAPHFSFIHYCYRKKEAYELGRKNEKGLLPYQQEQICLI